MGTKKRCSNSATMVLNLKEQYTSGVVSPRRILPLYKWLVNPKNRHNGSNLDKLAPIYKRAIRVMVAEGFLSATGEEVKDMSFDHEAAYQKALEITKDSCPHYDSRKQDRVAKYVTLLYAKEAGEDVPGWDRLNELIEKALETASEELEDGGLQEMIKSVRDMYPKENVQLADALMPIIIQGTEHPKFKALKNAVEAIEAHEKAPEEDPSRDTPEA